MQEFVFHFLAGLALDLVSIMDQFDQRAGLANVLEVSRHHRVEGLLHQFLDVPKALDHERGFLVVDVNHDRKRQGGLEGVLGDQGDFREVLIQVVGAHFGLDPLEDNVGRRNHHHFAGVGIEGILARQERIAPNTAAAFADEFAMAVFRTRKVFTDLTGVRDHHPHKPNFDNRLVDHFHRCKQPVEVIGAFHQNLQLAAAHT